MIAPGSFRFILPPLALSLILLIFIPPVAYTGFLFTFYLVWFFRDPTRHVEFNPNVAYSPADGKILSVDQTQNGLKIAIRMSPFNVHINRIPFSGFVSSIVHTPGSHGSVYFGNVEARNERNLLTVLANDIKFEILQITGIFARRIECWVEEDDTVEQGQKYGIIRFGSQTNLVIDAKDASKSIKPAVKVGDRVYAGLTVVASFQELNSSESIK